MEPRDLKVVAMKLHTILGSPDCQKEFEIQEKRQKSEILQTIDHEVFSSFSDDRSVGEVSFFSGQISASNLASYS